MPSWYVDPDQSDDSGTGESWATAKQHLNAMIQALTYPLVVDVRHAIRNGSMGQHFPL